METRRTCLDDSNVTVILRNFEHPVVTHGMDAYAFYASHSSPVLFTRVLKTDRYYHNWPITIWGVNRRSYPFEKPNKAFVWITPFFIGTMRAIIHAMVCKRVMFFVDKSKLNIDNPFKSLIICQLRREAKMMRCFSITNTIHIWGFKS